MRPSRRRLEANKMLGTMLANKKKTRVIVWSNWVLITPSQIKKSRSPIWRIVAVSHRGYSMNTTCRISCMSITSTTRTNLSRSLQWLIHNIKIKSSSQCLKAVKIPLQLWVHPPEFELEVTNSKIKPRKNWRVKKSRQVAYLQISSESWWAARSKVLLWTVKSAFPWWQAEAAAQRRAIILRIKLQMSTEPHAKMDRELNATKARIQTSALAKSLTMESSRKLDWETLQGLVEPIDTLWRSWRSMNLSCYRKTRQQTLL